MNRKAYPIAIWTGLALGIAWALVVSPAAHGQLFRTIMKPPSSKPAPKPRKRAMKPSSGNARKVIAKGSFTPPMESGQLMRTVKKIQLAWLSDPTTFSWRLGVQMTPSGLSVHGCVPNMVVKNRVLGHASQLAGFKVQDGIRVVPGMSVRTRGKVSEKELEDAARKAISQAAPDAVGRVKVSAKSTGQVTLSGMVNSMDEELTICKAMHNLRTCSSLVNKLSGSQLNRGSNSMTQMVSYDQNQELGPTLPDQPHPQPAYQSQGKEIINHPNTPNGVPVSSEKNQVQRRGLFGSDRKPVVQTPRKPSLGKRLAQAFKAPWKKANRTKRPTPQQHSVNKTRENKWTAVPISSSKVRDKFADLNPNQPYGTPEPAQFTSPNQNEVWTQVEVPSGNDTITIPPKYVQGSENLSELGEPYQTVAMVSWDTTTLQSGGQPGLGIPAGTVIDQNVDQVQQISSDKGTPPQSPITPVNYTPDSNAGGRPSVGNVEKLVHRACKGQAKGLSVSYLPDGKIKISFEAGSVNQGQELYGQIVSIPELGPYSLEVHARVQ